MEKGYSKNAGRYASFYEGVSPEQTYAPWLHLLPRPGAKVLDVGAGSGRDASWLEERGYQATAVEPSAAMRERARALHPQSSVRWIDDSLPLLNTVLSLHEKFALILVNAVWIHVSPDQRPAAMESLADLLDSKGVLIITLRHGPSPDERVMHPCSAQSLEKLAAEKELKIILNADLPDLLGRDEVSWTHMAFTQAAGESHEKYL
ncbi:Methyltransferase domain-containing protein [Desulfatibacillum alkenivorans DSM 16219]|jgi:SAM-dependent methyltransferase|uniref:Methyltransferase domain-containing protein n=1 Tax=Desulfatibacillum alkenivorans DSM 16219 TaxID=1121393 RepID=A0A1M6Q3K5_9BACT|nr:class I SAM-dependent methyltransferase [Desulfatibacillum alkenivorans]SHK14792.1 Methyltransferase domain-containing protein [Desulfatibacillum alkenivorans DSM 16219]